MTQRTPTRVAAGLLTAAVTTATLLAATPAHAETTDLPGIAQLADAVVSEQLSTGDVPGAAVVIVAGGEVVHTAGYGLADIASGTPFDPATTGFYTASTAKLFTAAAVLQLADRGLLDLDADVNDHLTAFDVPDTFPGKPVTLEHLLTHTAGFDPDGGTFATSAIDPADLPTLADSLAETMPERVREPGTVLAYDNYGVALAGHIVEQVAGVPYDRHIAENVFAPLGMTGSTAAQPHPAEIEATLATGYRPAGDGQTETAGNHNPWTPTGPGQVTTAADMARFMIDQLSGASLLGAGVPERMMAGHYAQDPRMPGMGYVYEERPRNGQRVLFKGGDGSGFHNDMSLLPERGIGVFLTVNGDGNGDFDGGALTDAILDRYFPQEPVTTAPQGIGGDVAHYEGTYRTSRLSRDGVLRARALTQSVVTVAANPDGTITTTGRTLSSDSTADSQIWVQTEPGFFQEIDGPGTLAISSDGVLTEWRGQNQVYLRIDWYERPDLHLQALLMALLGLVAALIAIPIVAVVRRGRERHPRAARAARLVGWLTAAVAVALTAAIVTLLSDPNAAFDLVTLGSPALYVLMIAATATVAATVAVCAGAVAAWVSGWWRIPGRIAHTLLALSAVTFSAVMIAYNLTGPPFN
ncbi:serine hydrolase domain-containing protein [Phytomonospora sp. NPDC050363]|uniref:serine hydrolase domain-containing protein n=1 Tax=Phytomonospora sp. NPDC050363 TaxID=3155642 RepID=UPI0033D2012B